MGSAEHVIGLYATDDGRVQVACVSCWDAGELVSRLEQANAWAEQHEGAAR